MRSKREVEDTISKIENAYAFGTRETCTTIDALKWILGKEDERFGPLKVQKPKGKPGRKKAEIDLDELKRLRYPAKGSKKRPWSLKELAKLFRCDKATICRRLKYTGSIEKDVDRVQGID